MNRGFTGIDKPDPDDPAKDAYNPYRFNAKRWDVSSGTYDMGFRDYNPELNRFTTQDMYNGALQDMGLTADWMTANRYAFTRGNPVNRIEIDGHMDCATGGDYSGGCGWGPSTVDETPSGPGEWGNAWMMNTDDTPSTDTSTSADEPAAAPAPQPKPIPAWENFLGGVLDCGSTTFGTGPLGDYLLDQTGCGNTKGLCLSVSYSAVGGTGSVSWMNTENGYDMALIRTPSITKGGSLNLDRTSFGPLDGFGGSVDMMFSNADDYSQLAEFAEQTDVSVGMKRVSIHGSWATGNTYTNDGNNLVGVTQLGVGTNTVFEFAQSFGWSFISH